MASIFEAFWRRARAPRSKHMGMKKPENAQTFQNEIYRILNPDLRESRIDLRRHYEKHGRREGRRVFPAREIFRGPQPRKDGAPEIVIVSPDAEYGASTTALTIAQYYAASHNVTLILNRGGPRVSDFLDHCVEVWLCEQIFADSYEAEAIAELIVTDIEPAAVIVNSVTSWHILPFLAQRFVPTVTLVHEFADYVRPDFVFSEMALWSHRVVFPAKIVLLRAKELHKEISGLSAAVLPQAVPITLPAGLSSQKVSLRNKTIRVMGAGSVEFRKGVDIFIQVCRELVEDHPEINWNFNWFGKGYDPSLDLEYSVYLRDQIKNSQIERHFSFEGHSTSFVEELEEADFFLLTSRLDPFPNVAIEAMRAGVPVICFRGASGISEFFAEQGLGESLVAKYLHPESMAALVAELVLNPAHYDLLRGEMRRLWTHHLSSDVFGARLSQIIEEAQKQVKEERSARMIIEEEGFVDIRPRSLISPQRSSKAAAITHYLRAEATGVNPFRPHPGFNPKLYVTSPGHASVNSYANFLEAGEPKGSWLSPVIELQPGEKELPSSLRTVIHIHVHYMDVLENLLEKMSPEIGRHEVVLSITEEAPAADVQDLFRRFHIDPSEIRVAPANGRNLSALFEIARGANWDDRTVVCHLHTKKSPQHELSVGEGWLDFLTQQLLGLNGDGSTSWILNSFVTNSRLGLVFPYDAFVPSWGENLLQSQRLSEEVGLPWSEGLETYPVGAMFWTRGSLIQAVARRLEHVSFEPEPLPHDGSTAHSLERLLPRLARHYGFQCAVTFRPNTFRK